MSRRFLVIQRLIGLFLMGLAVLVLWPKGASGPSALWIPYSDEALAQARADQRPVLVDIYADWCLPCVEMDHMTFHHPRVVEALAAVATVRLDVTAAEDVSAEAQQFLERHQIYGAPTILFFDRTGKERKDLRLLGPEDPEEFLRRLQHLLD